MSLNTMFDLIEKTRSSAHWSAAFGEPQIVEGKTVIPVAQVGYAYGFGFGPQKEPPGAGGTPRAEDEGSGGGVSLTKPLGALVVTPERACFEATMDLGRVAIAGCAVGALFIYQFAKTLRVILGSE